MSIARPIAGDAALFCGDAKLILYDPRSQAWAQDELGRLDVVACGMRLDDAWQGPAMCLGGVRLSHCLTYVPWMMWQGASCPGCRVRRDYRTVVGIYNLKPFCLAESRPSAPPTRHAALWAAKRSC